MSTLEIVREVFWPVLFFVAIPLAIHTLMGGWDD